jgi:hypothetical protein
MLFLPFKLSALRLALYVFESIAAERYLSDNLLSQFQQTCRQRILSNGGSWLCGGACVTLPLNDLRVIGSLFLPMSQCHHGF